MSDPHSQQGSGSETPIKTHNALGRGLGRPFQKGYTANPGGRPKGIEGLARQHTPAAISALVESLKDPKTRVVAACALLDRGWGRPRQQIEATGDGMTALHLLAAQSVSAELLAALGERRVTIDHVEPGETDDLLAPALE
jgi:hypothetical protein